MKTIHFLSGLPRAGSTLLGSILGQHHLIHVTPTSPVLDLMNTLNQGLIKVNQQYTFDFSTVAMNVYRGLFESFYQHINKPIIFDKHRGWPKNAAGVVATLGVEPRIICTYRPIPEVIASFLRLMESDPDNFVDRGIKNMNEEITLDNRCTYLWTHSIMGPLRAIKEAQRMSTALLISYDEIVLNTRSTLQRIGDFFGIDGVADLPLDHIENTCAESKDEAWGMKDLHTIRPTVEKQSRDAREVLGDRLYEYYSHYNVRLE